MSEPSAGEARPNSVWQSPHRTTLAVLTGCVVLVWAVMMSVFPVLPHIAAELRLDSANLGVLLAVSSLVMTVLNVPAGVLADRYGRKPPITIGLGLSAVGIVLAALSTSGPALLIVGWLVFGVGRGLFLSPAFTVPADLFSFQQRGKAIGVLAGGIGAGSVIGYVLGGLLAAGGSWQLVLWVDGVLLVIATVAAAMLPESLKEKLPSTLPRAFAQTFGWFTNRTVVLSGVVAGVAFAVGVAATFLVPFSLTVLNASAWLIAFVFIPYEVVASVGTTVAGAISDKIGRKPVLIGCLALVVVALALLPLVGVSVASVAIIYAFVGLAEGPAISLSTTMVTDEVLKLDPRRVGSALGANRLVQGIGPILGPVFGGLLVQELGIDARFWVLAAAGVVAVLLTLPLRGTPAKVVTA
ncbi:MFS transporter [Lentzea nigeriaca]|uniref:MFS transporter n=1 Tax=Lentzea nigeriaca TaxID=1128665 RepID=UPI00195956FE|nr:MFS transporter [Lentzea nigeriaca]MBM7858595.1 MFS family permease [Lentzea nigeriaca]